MKAKMKAKIESVKMTYSQEPDSCSNGSAYPVEVQPHELVVETFDAGGGPYLVISTGRWALDPEDIDAFADQLRAIAGMVPESAD